MFETIDLGTFEKRTGLRAPDNGAWQRVVGIVSLRDLVSIERIELMNDEYLTRLLQGVTLVGEPGARPYEGCKIRRMRIDPEMVSVGQRFVEKEKLLNLQTALFDIFHRTGATKGFAKKCAMVILGHVKSGDLAMAHYLPPIIERHGEMHGLLDGVHRSFTAMRTGTTIEAIRISNVTAPFPCGFGKWRDVRMVAEKPPKPERFHDLKPELFRDLKYIGIDG